MQLVELLRPGARWRDDQSGGTGAGDREEAVSGTGGERGGTEQGVGGDAGGEEEAPLADILVVCTQECTYSPRPGYKDTGADWLVCLTVAAHLCACKSCGKRGMQGCASTSNSHLSNIVSIYFCKLRLHMTASRPRNNTEWMAGSRGRSVVTFTKSSK
jgi:hypothetical protein